MIEFPFNEVEGLLSPADRVHLRDLAASCRDLPGVMVEIGSMYGASAVCLKSGAPDKRLYCHDFFEPDKLWKFNQAVKLSGFAGIEVIPGDFRKTFSVPLMSPKSICLGFVDHDHTYKSTWAAFDIIWPLLATKGLLLFHDYGHPGYGGGTAAINEIAKKLGRKSKFSVFDDSSIATLVKL